MSPPALALVYLAVAGLALLALWWAYRRPPTVTLRRDLAPAGFEGTRLDLALTLTVRSRRPLRFVLEAPAPRGVVPDPHLTVAGAGRGETTVEARAALGLNHRGVYAWPGATLRWADPLGLYWRSLPIGDPGELVVYPATHGLALPDVLRPRLSEGLLSRTLGLEDPLGLRGAREYVPGDPPGRVHWRLSARTLAQGGGLTVRELPRTASGSLCVHVDTGAGGDTYVDSAARLGASLLQEALALGLPVSVSAAGQVSPPGRSDAAVQGALRLLAGLRPEPGQDHPLGAVPPGANLFLITAHPRQSLIAAAMRARASASRVTIVALPEGYYLEPGEKARRQWAAPPDAVRGLERQAGALAGAGILVVVLRGNQSVLRLGASA